MQRLAIYDLDQTITRRPTLPLWLRSWVRHEAPWRAVLLPVALVYAALYVAGQIDRGGFKQHLHRLFMGRAVAASRIAARAQVFAAAQLATNIYPQALTQIAADRAAGYRVVIATASYEFYVDALASAIGVDDVIGTRAVVADGCIRARIDGENCYGPAKLRMVEAWLAAHDLTGADMRFYSDHASDAPMFERAGAPVATNPSRALTELARARGWPVIDWR